MITVKEYEAKRLRAENLKQQADKAEGALDELMGRLEDEFGCKTMKQGRAKLAKIKKDRENLETKYNDAAEGFEQQWGDLLNDSSKRDTTATRRV